MGRKSTLPYLILIVAVTTFAVLFMFRDAFLGGNLPIGEVKRLSVDKELVPISDKSLLLTNNGIMIEAENSNLRARNMEGTVLWTMKLSGNVISMMSCGKDVVVNIENRRIVTVSRSGQMLWEYEMTIPAYDILTSDKGLLLLQYNEDKYNSFEIFNINGVRSCAAILNDAHVIAFDGVPGKHYTLSLLDVSSDEVHTKIVTYNNKGEILWANNLEDILITDIEYNEKGDMIAISENSIRKFKDDGKLDKDIDFTNSISKVSAGSNFIVSIVKSQDYYEVFVHDYSLKQLGTAAIKSKPDGIFAGDTYFLIYDKDNITLFNKQGKVSAVYESNIDINSAYIDDDSIVYIISNRKLQKLSL